MDRTEIVPPSSTGCQGFCQNCGKTHTLAAGQAHHHALELMQNFRSFDRPDFLTPKDEADPRLEGKRLWTNEGLMFGVLECLNKDGNTVILKAFSSLPGGVRWVDGWAPKLLNHAARKGYQARGLVEFYWGAAMPSGNRVSGEFYSCCESRCQPILGFLLCGIDS